MIFYAVTIFLSAFLLFQVQPMIAKIILPWFGGSSAVWSTCMLFFQSVLLLGYASAHWMHARLRPNAQAVIYTLSLAVSLAVLPILPNPAWKPSSVDNPSLRILGLLGLTVGLPYLLLSTISPMLQAWYARTHKQALPYRLYALSNLGSMLALLSYPVLVEPYLATRRQAQVWSIGYAIFVLLCGATAWRARQGTGQVPGHPALQVAGPSWGLRALWMTLPACASVLLLAVTTHLTQNVAPIPLLWILPLSTYLLTFIICFEAPRCYVRAVFLPAFVAAVAAMAYLIWPGSTHPKVALSTLIFVSALFVCCMVCHGELAARKPHPAQLTSFYLMVSLGGALGGFFVALAAPHLFNSYHEFPIGLAVAAILIVMIFWRRVGGWWRIGTAAALAGYLVFLGIVIRDSVKGYRLAARNFYGQLRVRDQAAAEDEEAQRVLVHGTIIHGRQALNEQHRRYPGTYFCPESGVGRLMRAGKTGEPRQIGILGLGCGTLAAYGRPGDTIRIYEINPLVTEFAQREFSYLRDTPARVEIQMGDGRLSLERETSQQFDILVMDAFSGDSVPVHLITREALQIYFRHLKPDGVLAFNISNSYLDLKPVVARLAADSGRLGLFFEFTPEDEDSLCLTSYWALILSAATRTRLSPWLDGGEMPAANPRFRGWTDDYSNIWGILR